ncbi:hypothetical protein [Pontiella agarivorans]|uniref:Uncharacterized protein n=1 Tax=Pontiella agarivorans TaxID=3038953 RepID=A0ABU5MZQ0_9BACT|nr:hypothetical protein [Pontiella agarivorans]MDZ8119685.1 hypothetical protein [Pontiella agarivorans]
MNQKLNNKIWIKGLIMECPHKAAVRNCPLRELRGKSEREANRIVDEMDDEEVRAILSAHRACYERRLKDWGDPVC